MAFLRRPVSRASLTSAASRIIDPEDPKNRSLAPDASSLYGLYDRLGQIRAALQFKSMAASKIDYYPARKLDPGEAPERTEDPRVVEAFDALRGPLGEFADFVAEFCLHLDIAGEGYLVGKSDGEWDAWSAVEYDRNRNQQAGSREQDAVQPLSGADFILRVWRPHPMMRHLPDSALRSVAPECEQYILLRGMLTSIAQSRLMAGILQIPDGWSFPPKENGEEADSFFDSLYDSISSAANSVDSASRLVPTVVQRDQGQGDAVFLDLARDLPEWVPTLMERVLRQIATGLDLPADILLGIADVNHWNAWLSEDSAKLDYVDPLVLLILDSLTRGYLHPVLQEAGVTDPESYLFWRDYSDLIARSVGTQDAVELFDRGIISDEAVRRVVGFTDTDAPSEDEDPVAPPSTELPVGSDNVERGVPGTLPVIMAAGQKVGLGQIDHRLYAQISEAAQAALDRVLEKAGGKIRSKAVGDSRRPAKHPTLAAQIQKVPNIAVGLTVGPSVKATLQLTDSDLVPEGSFDMLGKRVDKILESGQDETFQTITELTGQEPERNEEQESKWRQIAIETLLAGLGVLALRKLFTPDLEQDPAITGEVASTQIPAPLVWDTLTLSSGAEPGFGPEALRGLANGQQTIEWLDQVGFAVEEKEWTIGAPTRQFEPHRALRGVRITQYTDPRLATPPTASWLGVSFMFPGDHSGCQCALELVVVQAFRGDSPASPATGGTSGAMPNEAMVPIWDPDTRTFLRLEQRDIEYVGLEGVAPDIQAAIKRGVNSYPPEFRPPRVEVVDFIDERLGPSGIAETFGYRIGKGQVRLSKEMFSQGAARVEHVTRHELGHWKQQILEDQAERAGFTKRADDLKNRLDAVVDDLMPDLETAERLGLDYPWLVRSAHKKQIPGARGNWDQEFFAEISAHLSEGRAVPQVLADLVEKYSTFSTEEL